MIFGPQQARQVQQQSTIVEIRKKGKKTRKAEKVEPSSLAAPRTNMLSQEPMAMQAPVKPLLLGGSSSSFSCVKGCARWRTGLHAHSNLTTAAIISGIRHNTQEHVMLSSAFKAKSNQVHKRIAPQAKAGANISITDSGGPATETRKRVKSHSISKAKYGISTKNQESPM